MDGTGQRRPIHDVVKTYLQFSISEMATGQAKNRHVVFQTKLLYGFRNLTELHQNWLILRARTLKDFLRTVSLFQSPTYSCQV